MQETTGDAAPELLSGVPEGAAAVKAHAPLEPGKGALCRVLVVADDDLIRTDIVYTLAESGYAVATATSDVRTALDYVADAAQDLHCALLDVDLSGESCLQLASSLESMNIPYLIVTAYSETEVRDMGFRAPLLEKPFRNGELSMRVSGLIRSTPAEDA